MLVVFAPQVGVFLHVIPHFLNHGGVAALDHGRVLRFAHFPHGA